jgi:hypothetical protein
LTSAKQSYDRRDRRLDWHRHLFPAIIDLTQQQDPMGTDGLEFIELAAFRSRALDVAGVCILLVAQDIFSAAELLDRVRVSFDNRPVFR